METSPMMITNPVTNTDARRETRKKRKKNVILNQSRDQQSQYQSKNRWKSEGEQEVYVTKLAEALRKIQLNPPSSSNEAPKGGRAVREAADRVLAVAAKGRTRWSRAILTNRPLKMKFMKQKKPKGTVAQSNRPKKPTVSVLGLKKNLPAVQRKVRCLGRIVPGCRKQPLPALLEETTDYIAALQMQIRAMTALTQLLSGTGTSTMPAQMQEHTQS